MQPSANCYDLIKQFEGLVLHAYPDPGTGAEPITIGYGTTIYPEGQKVKLGDVITRQRADECLRHEVDKKSVGVNTVIGSTPLTQNQFDACVSFSYNLGLGGFKKLFSHIQPNPNDVRIGEEFMKWTKAGGKTMPGLIKRRQAEATLYFS